MLKEILSNPLLVRNYFQLSSFAQKNHPAIADLLQAQGKATKILAFGVRICYFLDQLAKETGKDQRLVRQNLEGEALLEESFNCTGFTLFHWS